MASAESMVVQERIKQREQKEADQEQAMKDAGPLKRAYLKTMDVLNGTAMQACIYMVFVVIFQQLAGCVRMPKEFYLDKHVMDRIVENHFDSSHNTFETVRRIADIYEWGNNVLWPGLFADMGPCNSTVGVPDAYSVKGCNDDAWPDGEGPFHVEGATPFPIGELVERMDQFDWTEGILIKQVGRRAPCVRMPQRGAGPRVVQRSSQQQ